jgi:hypothetical protein
MKNEKSILLCGSQIDRSDVFGYFISRNGAAMQRKIIHEFQEFFPFLTCFLYLIKYYK